jgi:hypothetical protein
MDGRSSRRSLTAIVADGLLGISATNAVNAAARQGGRQRIHKRGGTCPELQRCGSTRCKRGTHCGSSSIGQCLRTGEVGG